MRALRSFFARDVLIPRVARVPVRRGESARAVPDASPLGKGAWWAEARAALRTVEGQRRLAWALTLALMAADILIIGERVLVRHIAFNSYAFDLGNMDQAVWNTLHGHPFRFTNRGIDWFGPPTRLAIHVEPILLLIAPLYLIHSGAETLLVLQTVALALGALPVLALALRRLPDMPLLGVAFVAAYLVSPQLLGEAFYDFHPVTLATPLLLGALWALAARRMGWFLTCAVLAAACKEDVALAVAPLGVYLALWQRRPRLGWSLAVAAVGWTALCFLVIMPHFNAGASDGGNAYWYRYATLGDTPAEALREVLTNPFSLLPLLFTTPKLGYLALLARTAGGLGLFAPLWLLPALPELAINLLSEQAPQYSGFYHYNAIILPITIAAGIAGTAALRHARARALAGEPDSHSAIDIPALGPLTPWARQIAAWWQRLLGRVPLAPRAIPRVVAVWLLLTLVWNMVAIQPKLHGFWDGGAGLAPHQAQIDALLARIPPDAVVAATDTLDPHLSDRPTIYLMPDPMSYQAEYVAAELTRVPANTRLLVAAMYTSMASSGRYRVLGVAGSVVVLQRVGPPLVASNP